MTVSSLPISTAISCGCGATDEKPITPINPAKESVFSIAVSRPKTIAQLKESNQYYSSLKEDAKGEDLFNQLHSIQMQHISGIGSYDDLWTTYKSAFIDNYDEKDGTILDIYEENPLGPDVHVYTPGKSQDRGGKAKEGDFYNREHLVPQSVFDVKDKRAYRNIPSRNDAHFVFPADKIVNTRHGDVPYDKVMKGQDISANGTRSGTNKNGDKVVEPINAFKGDVARASLYFALTWRIEPKYNPSTKIFSPFLDNKMFPVMTDVYQKIYSAWSKMDPVSQWDVDRNEEVARLQGGIRNPFTDMPMLIDLIWM